MFYFDRDDPVLPDPPVVTMSYSSSINFLTTSFENLLKVKFDIRLGLNFDFDISRFF